MKTIIGHKWGTLILALALSVGLVVSGSALALNVVSRPAKVNRSDIDAYVHSVRQMNRELIAAEEESISASLTFAQYLSLSEFDNFVQAHDLDVEQVQLRGQKDDGTRVTIFANYNHSLEEIAAAIDLNATEGKYSLVGVTSCFALVDSSNLPDIEADTAIYLVDTSGDQRHYDSCAKNSIAQNGVDVCRKKGSFPQPITWELENAGLMDVADR